MWVQCLQGSRCGRSSPCASVLTQDCGLLLQASLFSFDDPMSSFDFNVDLSELMPEATDPTGGSGNGMLFAEPPAVAATAPVPSPASLAPPAMDLFCCTTSSSADDGELLRERLRLSVSSCSAGGQVAACLRGALVLSLCTRLKGYVLYRANSYTGPSLPRPCLLTPCCLCRALPQPWCRCCPPAQAAAAALSFCPRSPAAHCRRGW